MNLPAASITSALLIAVGSVLSVRGDPITIENARVRMELNLDATWRKLVDKRTGRELCHVDGRTAVVDARFGRDTERAAHLAFSDGRLTVRFRRHDTELRYKISVRPDWVLFYLDDFTGTPPDALTLLRVPVCVTNAVGAHLNIARDEGAAVCLLAANLQSDGRAIPRKGWTELRVTTQNAPGPSVKGAAAALVVAAPGRVRERIQEAATALGLPVNTRKGVPAKELPEAKASYWFLGFAERDVESVIALCDRSGIRQVMLSFGAWSTGSGHYVVNTGNYPRGIESLKATVDRLHAADILVGMHTFASKVKKTDPYVTPVPDHRFWKEMQATLAEDVSATQTQIRVSESLREWPGSPVCSRSSWEGGVAKHREVIIGDEIIRYAAIDAAGRCDTFLGCERGAWKTHAAPHAAGESAFHFGVDGCINGYIIDQETSLLDEVTVRLAGVFNTCGFDMVYFDGGEDVDRRRFNYYVTRHQAAAMRKFTRRPVLHMGTIMTHGLWHSFARAGTVDHYMNTMRGYMVARGGEANVRRVREIVDGVVRRTVAYDLQGERHQWHTVKEHVDRSVRRTLEMEKSLMPSELGWFGVWPKNPYSDGLQLDEFEYLMVKSLAYDQPISLQTSFARIEAHPLAPQILEMAATYETMRLKGSALDALAREKLRRLGKDFAMIRRGGTAEFVEVHEVTEVICAGDRVRAFVGSRGSNAVATVWHVSRGGTLTLEIDPARIEAKTFSGETVSLERKENCVAVPVNNRRTTLFVRGVSGDELFRLFGRASFEEAPPTVIWLQAEDWQGLMGDMAVGAGAGTADGGALGDIVLSVKGSTPFDSLIHYSFCEYTVDLPRHGLWTVWGRMRYPSGSDDSFWLSRPGIGEKFVLGNCGADAKRWHWCGSGSGSTGEAPGRPILIPLDAGPFTFRIHPREGRGEAALNPRLDCLCITDDPKYRPADADARRALGSTVAE